MPTAVATLYSYISVSINNVDNVMFVLQDGLSLAIQTVQDELPVLQIFSGGIVYYNDDSRFDELRSSEKSIYELNDDGYVTRISYDQKDVSVQNALFSIYTTSFIIVLLVVSAKI